MMRGDESPLSDHLLRRIWPLYGWSVLVFVIAAAAIMWGTTKVGKPVWMLPLIFGLALGYVLLMRKKIFRIRDETWKNARAGNGRLCIACGYPGVEGSAVCPECGGAVVDVSAQLPPRDKPMSER